MNTPSDLGKIRDAVLRKSYELSNGSPKEHIRFQVVIEDLKASDISEDQFMSAYKYWREVGCLENDTFMDFKITAQGIDKVERSLE